MIASCLQSDRPSSRQTPRFRFITLLIAVIALPPNLGAQDPSGAVPGIGDAVPGWNALTGVDGKEHPMDEYTDASVLVVCFTSNTCPYSVDYEQRLNDLHRKFENQAAGVRLVAINSNAVDADDLEHMKARAEEKQFLFPCLKDADQSVARAWGAIYTPEFFVLNAKRELVYKGALDDNTKAGKVTLRYVEAAVEAALAGKLPEVTEVPARGCTIRFPRRRAPVPDPISRPDR